MNKYTSSSVTCDCGEKNGHKADTAEFADIPAKTELSVNAELLIYFDQMHERL